MFKKGLLTGLALLVVSFIVNWLVGSILPEIALEYQNVGLFRPMNDPLMVLFFVYPFIFGFAAYYLWRMVSSKFKGSTTDKALAFAKGYFIFATIPGMFATYTSFQVSLGMTLLWAATGFINAFVAGYIFARK